MLHCNDRSGHLKTEHTESLRLLRRHLGNWSHCWHCMLCLCRVRKNYQLSKPHNSFVCALYLCHHMGSCVVANITVINETCQLRVMSTWEVKPVTVSILLYTGLWEMCTLTHSNKFWFHELSLLKSEEPYWKHDLLSWVIMKPTKHNPQGL
jgi:hypothetical protein